MAIGLFEQFVKSPEDIHLYHRNTRKRISVQLKARTVLRPPSEYLIKIGRPVFLCIYVPDILFIEIQENRFIIMGMDLVGPFIKCVDGGVFRKYC